MAFLYVIALDSSLYGLEHIKNPFDSEGFMGKIYFLIIVILLNYIKTLVYRMGYFENAAVFFLFRLSGTAMASYAVVFAGIGAWGHVIILMSIIITSVFKGARKGYLLLGVSFVIYVIMLFAREAINNRLGITGDTGLINDLLIAVFILFTFGLIAAFCGMISKDILETESENVNLVKQLNEKYAQLELAQVEIKYQYDKLKGTNARLEEANKRLSGSIAEFYTLQQITNAISSILDIRELLKYLNDIIIGVMGVSNSTISLYDEKLKRLKVHTTNVLNPVENSILTGNINCNTLLEALENNRYIIDNETSPVIYPFTEHRDVGSMIVMPLRTNNRKFGLVIIEHKLENYFDEDNVRLLEIISKQVGIAMENAEYYQKMEELASKDGLTGIFNRQYIEDKLDEEFVKAREQKIPLSVAIFDIDHFKKFNDTFGHLFGDKVLKSIAKNVAAALHNDEIFARFGGEEFLILFPGLALDAACEKVEAIRKMISTMQVQDNHVKASVTVSFGVSSYDECTTSLKGLLGTADDALYEAKECGRNCVMAAKLINIRNDNSST